MSAKLWYMVEAPLLEMPFPLASLADVLSDDRCKRRCIQQLFTMPLCDVDLGMGEKLRIHFQNVNSYAPQLDLDVIVDNVLADIALMDWLLLWVKNCSVENMVVERIEVDGQ